MLIFKLYILSHSQNNGVEVSIMSNKELHQVEVPQVPRVIMHCVIISQNLNSWLPFIVKYH